MMKKISLLAMAILFFAMQQTFAQLTDEEYSYVTMDLQGILDLRMTTDPQVDFTFKSIAQYQNGIVKFNATKLEVDATVAWDLFAYASTDNWIQVEGYSTNGEGTLPAEILEIQSASANASAPLGGTFDAFVSLKGLTNSGVLAGVPDADETQFLAGMVGTGAGESYEPGSAAGNPETNMFRLHYRLVPDIPATFPNSTVPLGGVGYAQAGYYYIEVVYALVEDL